MSVALFFVTLAAPAKVFEVRGELIPRSSAAVTLHGNHSPFTKTTLTDPSGAFRFQNIEAGSYTISAYVPRRGETRRTIDVGAGSADAKGRVRVELRMEDRAINREPAAKVSVRELSIPEEARRLYRDAGKRLEKRDIAGAIKHLERAVEIAPKYSAAWNHLGTIAYQTRRYKDAERYFREGIEADPQAYEPVVNLGGVLINLGNLEEAWQFNVEAVLRHPNDALAHSQLGMTYLALNKVELAEKHLLEAVRLDPGHFSHPQMHLAELYLRRGDRAQAGRQLADFLKHHPDWPAAAKIRETIAKW